MSIAAYNKYKDLFNTRRISDHMKVRHYNAFILPILLYNSELWTLNKKLENKINVFHRKQLRRILKCYWPRVIKNEDLYKRTKQSEITTVIKGRRLRWLGHLCRLHEDTPAKKCVVEYFRPVRKPIGAPQTTWFHNINKDLKEMKIGIIVKDIESFYKLCDYCADRIKWRVQTRKLVALDRPKSS